MAKVKLDEFDVMFGNSDVIKPAEKCDKVDTWYDKIGRASCRERV